MTVATPARPGARLSRARLMRSLSGPILPLVVALPLALLPVVVAGRITILNVANYALIYSVVAVGLQLLYGTTKLMSLAQATFLAMGAYAAGIVTATFGGPHLAGFFVAALLPAVVAFPVGWFISRVRGYYLAVATLALAALFSLWVRQFDVTGRTFGLTGITPPEIFGVQFSSPASFYLLALTVAALTLALGAALLSSRVGRALYAIGQSEAGANASGVHLVLYKASAFALSAGLAGSAGALYVYYVGFIGPETFTLQTSILLLSMVIVGGADSLYGAVLGAVLLTALPPLLGSDSAVSVLLYAAVLIVVFVVLPDGLMGLLRRIASLGSERLTASRSEGPPREVVVGSIDKRPLASIASATAWRALGPPAGFDDATWYNAPLVGQGLSKHFAGLRVFDNIEFLMAPGSVTSIIGPNGAGKTTLFRIISGSERQDKGSVSIGDRSLNGLQPYQVCRLGIGRVFQHPQVSARMTVRENIMLGLHSRTSAGFVSCGLRLPKARAEERMAQCVADEIIDMVGLTKVGDSLTGDLPFGHQRLVEMGRAIAPRPRWLLLDEPTAGLNPTELELFKIVLKTINSAGVSVVLVEHNVPFVVDVSSRAIVLNAGTLIFDGAPSDAVRDRAVIDAYLG